MNPEDSKEPEVPSVALVVGLQEMFEDYVQEEIARLGQLAYRNHARSISVVLVYDHGAIAVSVRDEVLLDSPPQSPGHVFERILPVFDVDVHKKAETRRTVWKSFHIRVVRRPAKDQPPGTSMAPRASCSQLLGLRRWIQNKSDR